MNAGVETAPQDISTTAIAQAIYQSAQLRNGGDFVGALAVLEDLLQAVKLCPIADLDRASLLCDMGRFEESLAIYAELLESGLGSADLIEQRQHVLAQALQHCQPDSLAHARLLVVSQSWKDVERICNALMTSDPHCTEARKLRALAYAALNQPHQAKADLEVLVDAEPRQPSHWYHLAMERRKLRDLNGARAAFEVAVQLDPQSGHAHIELAHTELALRDFSNGWQHYEWRWRTPQMSWRRPGFEMPQWDGQEYLAGKTLLVWAEQGLGDAIQFARYLPLLCAQGIHVALLVPQSLLSILGSLPIHGSGQLRLYSDTSRLPQADRHIPLMSVPGCLNADECWSGPYLFAPTELRAAWRERLGPRTRPTVGIVWAGRKSTLGNPGRDIDLSLFSALADKDKVNWVVLQPEISEAEMSGLAHWPHVLQVGKELGSFADTAALLSELDLVLTVDSAVAHLCGALGKTGIVLLRHSIEWRWPPTERSLWYPSLHLQHQTMPGDWSSALAALSACQPWRRLLAP